MRKIKINPKYEYLRAFIESIPDIFEKEGKEIYHQRNIIKVLSAPDGTIVNIKRFHQPRSLNRLIYSWNIRVPKGKRAYDYSFLLNHKGIQTPEAVALIEERNNLNLLGYSYLITLQCDYPHTLYDIKDAQPGEYEQLAKFLARYAAKMHLAGIMHKDFTPGNILWKKDNEGIHFMIVDINRMHFGQISTLKGLDNMKRFWGPKHFTEILAEEYAQLKCYNTEKAVKYILKKRKKFWTRYLKKHEVPFTMEL